MGVLSFVRIATLTKNVNNAGTSNAIVIIVNENGVDKVQGGLPVPQKKGSSWLETWDARDTDIHTQNLTNQSIRIGIRGEDAWHPEHILETSVHHQLVRFTATLLE